MSKLPGIIVEKINYEMSRHDWKCIPYIIDIASADKIEIYTPVEKNTIALVFTFNTKTKENKVTIGSWSGSERYTDVDTDNKKVIILDKDVFVVKMIVASNYKIKSCNVYTNIFNMPKNIVLLDLSNREREILFLFVRLKNKWELNTALDKLGVSPLEIKDLIQRGVLKNSKKTPAPTISALVAKSDSTVDDRW